MMWNSEDQPTMTVGWSSTRTRPAGQSTLTNIGEPHSGDTFT